VSSRKRSSSAPASRSRRRAGSSRSSASTTGSGSTNTSPPGTYQIPPRPTIARELPHGHGTVRLEEATTELFLAVPSVPLPPGLSEGDAQRILAAAASSGAKFSGAAIVLPQRTVHFTIVAIDTVAELVNLLEAAIKAEDRGPWFENLAHLVHHELTERRMILARAVAGKPLEDPEAI
jgi:hypothetical protein